MAAAIDEAKSSTKSIRSISSDNGVAESFLRFRLKRMKAGGNLQKVGKKSIFSDIEGELANCISVLCNNGFSPSLFEIRECVREYLTLNNKIKSPFQDNRPGRNWMKSFLNRNKLSLKKASAICVSRKSNTVNPFVIYHFYEKLAEIFKSHPDLTAEKNLEM